MQQIFNLFGLYVTIIGTWRLANATIKQPIGNFLEVSEEDKVYNPLQDLLSPHKVVIWFFNTVTTIKHEGGIYNCVICHKKFNWGLFWLLIGIVLQYISTLFD